MNGRNLLFEIHHTFY